MELPSIESQGYEIAPYNLRKRKRGPSKDQKEDEKLPKSKIPRREKCLPILPHESKITKVNYYMFRNIF